MCFPKILPSISFLIVNILSGISWAQQSFCWFHLSWEQQQKNVCVCVCVSYLCAGDGVMSKVRKWVSDRAERASERGCKKGELERQSGKPSNVSHLRVNGINVVSGEQFQLKFYNKTETSQWNEAINHSIALISILRLPKSIVYFFCY